MKNKVRDEKNIVKRPDEQNDMSNINPSEYPTNSNKKSFLSKILLVSFYCTKKTVQYKFDFLF